MTSLKYKWIIRGGWIADLPARFPPAPHKDQIEAISAANHARIGKQHVAPEYDLPDAKYSPKDVRSPASQGNFYTWLVRQRRPETVIEFGAAFGVSGMYFSDGLESNGFGHLYSFEINDAWADVAEASIAQISNRFTLTRGAFEQNINIVPKSIDIAFVDGIHTYDFVKAQWEILRPLMTPGGLVLFDDIRFGQGMHEAWMEIAQSGDAAGAVEFRQRGRLGVLECKK